MQFFASTFSARLASSQAGQIDDEIRAQLVQLIELLDAACVCWYSQRRSDRTLVRVYDANRAETEKLPKLIRLDAVPYFTSCLLRGEKVALSSVDDLPVDARRDREFLRRYSINAVLMVPSNFDSVAKGVLAVAYTSWRKWSSSLLNQIEILGNVIVAAVERKAAQQARQTSERLFHGLFEQATIGIAIEDLDGRIRYANPALSALLGRSQRELLRMSCANFKNDGDGDDECKLFQKLRSGEADRYEIEKRYARKDGATITGRLRVSLLKGSEIEQPLVIAMLEDITRRKKAEEDLKRTKSDLQMLADRLIRARDEERQRISRELHDDIGQRLSVFASALHGLKSDLLRSDLKTESRRAAELLGQVNDLATDVHRLSHELHSSKLQHLGLCAALRELIRQLPTYNIRGRLTCQLLTDPLPSDIALCLFRITQESLRNVIRHSKAKEVTVKVVESNSVIQLMIRDTGVGFDRFKKPGGLGLISMRERLRMVGGTLAIDSDPQKGTQITATVRTNQASLVIPAAA